MQDIADQDARRDRSIKIKLALAMLAAILALAISATVSARNVDRLADEQQAIAQQVKADHAPLNEVRREYVGLLRAVGQYARTEQPDAEEAFLVQAQHERLAQDLKQFRSGSADDDFRSQLSTEARLAISAASDTLEGALDLFGAGQYAQARSLLRNGTDALLSVLIVMDQRLAVGEQAFGTALAQVDVLEERMEQGGWLLAIAVAAVLLGFAAGYSRSSRPQPALRPTSDGVRTEALHSLILAVSQGSEQRERLRPPEKNGAAGALLPSHADTSSREREAMLDSLCPVDGLHSYEDLTPLAALDEMHTAALQDFILIHRNIVEAMRKALDARDIDGATRLATSLSIKAEMIGASDLAAIGREMELALMERDLTAAKRLTHRIAEPLQQLTRELQAGLPQA